MTWKCSPAGGAPAPPPAAPRAGGAGRTGRPWVTGDLGATEWSYVFSDPGRGEYELHGCDLFTSGAT